MDHDGGANGTNSDPRVGSDALPVIFEGFQEWAHDALFAARIFGRLLQRFFQKPDQKRDAHQDDDAPAFLWGRQGR